MHLLRTIQWGGARATCWRMWLMGTASAVIRVMASTGISTLVSPIDQSGFLG
jgi:hypothetical protein